MYLIQTALLAMDILALRCTFWHVAAAQENIQSSVQPDTDDVGPDSGLLVGLVVHADIQDRTARLVL